MRLGYIWTVILLVMLFVSPVVSALHVHVAAVGPDTVVIEWDESESTAFGYYQIWREEVGESNSAIVDTWADRDKTKYTDDNVEAGQKYNYTVKVFDDQNRFLDQGFLSVTPCLERDWMMFVIGMLIILLLIIILRFLAALPPQVLVPIVALLIGIAGALMWLSNVASDVPSCP